MALINYLTRIYFADRVLEDALFEQLKLLGISRPLVVTDKASEDSEAVSRLKDALPSAFNVTIHRITSLQACEGADPANSISSIGAAFTDAGCDGYVGLGGEAALSLARRATYERLGWMGERGRTPGNSSVPPKRAFLIAVPTTTACVGLQPMPASVARRGGHIGLPECAMLPDAVLCDPTLTVEQDGRATAAAGMDALTHCIEAYLGMTWNPPADGIAIDGVRRAMGSLELAVRDGTNLNARREMMAAALDAGLAAQKGLGAVEALAHSLEAETDHNHAHGWLHAALLPVVLRFNSPAIGARMATLRSALHVSLDEDVPQAIAALGASIHLPSSLALLGLDKAARHRVAQRAGEHPATRTNPRHVTAADYLRLLEDAD